MRNGQRTWAALVPGLLEPRQRRRPVRGALIIHRGGVLILLVVDEDGRPDVVIGVPATGLSYSRRDSQQRGGPWETVG
jgi:hypothetical protein